MHGVCWGKLAKASLTHCFTDGTTEVHEDSPRSHGTGQGWRNPMLAQASRLGLSPVMPGPPAAQSPFWSMRVAQAGAGVWAGRGWCSPGNVPRPWPRRTPCMQAPSLSASAVWSVSASLGCFILTLSPLSDFLCHSVPGSFLFSRDLFIHRQGCLSPAGVPGALRALPHPAPTAGVASVHPG